MKLFRTKFNEEMKHFNKSESSLDKAARRASRNCRRQKPATGRAKLPERSEKRPTDRDASCYAQARFSLRSDTFALSRTESPQGHDTHHDTQLTCKEDVRVSPQHLALPRFVLYLLHLRQSLILLNLRRRSHLIYFSG